jgi:hypothetical protein
MEGMPVITGICDDGHNHDSSAWHYSKKSKEKRNAPCFSGSYSAHVSRTTLVVQLFDANVAGACKLRLRHIPRAFFQFSCCA